MTLQHVTLADLVPGDRCIVADGDYSHLAGQEVIVCAKDAHNDFNPPTSETRTPVVVPESGRLMLLSPSTPVLVEG